MKPELAPPNMREQAALWFSLQRSGRMSAQEARELELWLARDPEHKAALDRMARLWRGASSVRHDPELMEVREAVARERAGMRARRGLITGAVAASTLIALGAGGWALFKSGALNGLSLFKPPQEQVLRTGVGQTTTVKLADGSVVMLDTDTVLRARETRSRREIELERGQAFFTVAKDRSRPFIVTAGGKTVTATGTAFEVRFEPNRFEVTLIEGRVTVEAPKGQSWEGGQESSQTAHMRAGWRLTSIDDEKWTVSPVDVNKEMSWLDGWLTFNNEPLEAVAAEMNRYSHKKIVIRDSGIAQTPIVGGFKTDDVDGLVRMVQSYKLARVANDGEDAVELVSPRK